MNKILLFVVACSFALVGCEKSPTKAEHETAKLILQNRLKYADQIQTAMNTCLNNSKNSRDLEDTDNDSAEIVYACKQYSLELYNSDSPWISSYLYKSANTEY